MRSSQEFADFVIDQIASAGDVGFRKMFGSYAIYCDKKVVALICDNQLFVKPTSSGRKYIGEVIEAPPFKKARNFFLITEKIEDSDWMTGLIKITTEELPLPKIKPKRAKLPNPIF